MTQPRAFVSQVAASTVVTCGTVRASSLVAWDGSPAGARLLTERSRKIAVAGLATSSIYGGGETNGLRAK
jgi:hypothetical protein